MTGQEPAVDYHLYCSKTNTTVVFNYKDNEVQSKCAPVWTYMHAPCRWLWLTGNFLVSYDGKQCSSMNEEALVN